MTLSLCWHWCRPVRSASSVAAVACQRRQIKSVTSGTATLAKSSFTSWNRKEKPASLAHKGLYSWPSLGLECKAEHCLKGNCQSGFWRPLTTWRCKYTTRRPYKSHITTQEDAITTEEEPGFLLWKKYPEAWPCMNVKLFAGSKPTVQHSEAHITAQWGTQQRS